ncbi:hypothetical protein EDC01DRAFT_667757 [Geopyxis carbonaria]|nr:hypothetical protein EDC01DRAFT_667757 [Geopyxis carbonaria]
MSDPRRHSHRSSGGRPQTYEQWQLPTSSFDHPSYSDSGDDLYYAAPSAATSLPPWPTLVPPPPSNLEWIPTSGAGDPTLLYPSPTSSINPYGSTSPPSHYVPQSPATPTPDASGRYYCTFHSCPSSPTSRVFTRKSDYRRHMDKHTRPYTCPYAQCAELAGFGWVGGLNRHLEEIHNSAGAQHKCPYSDCKRHVRGFNRVANLKKHMRVHEAGGVGSAGSGEGEGESSGGRDHILREIRDAERELSAREREEQEARRRRAEVQGRLEELRSELMMEEGGYF